MWRKTPISEAPSSRVLQVPVHSGDPGSGRPDEERRRDEGLGQHDRQRRERNLQADGVEDAAQRSPPAQHQEQGQAGHGGWQDEGRVHDRLDQPRAPEPAAGQQEGEWKPEGNREDQ